MSPTHALTDAEAARIYGGMHPVPGAPGCRRYGFPPRNITDPQCFFRGRDVPVLRVLWEAVYGAVPEGKRVRRVCRTKGCCTVAHARVLSRTPAQVTARVRIRA